MCSFSSHASHIIVKPLRTAIAGGDKKRADLELVPAARGLAQHSKRDPARLGSPSEVEEVAHEEGLVVHCAGPVRLWVRARVGARVG